jgi:hypothetical protein
LPDFSKVACNACSAELLFDSVRAFFAWRGNGNVVVQSTREEGEYGNNSESVF